MSSLIDLLTEWLPKQRWFAAKGVDLHAISIASESVLEAEEQTSMEADLAVSGKGRERHMGMADSALLRELIERHLKFTGSTRALRILEDWDKNRAKFVKIFPNEYKRALGEFHAQKAAQRAPAAYPAPRL